MATSADRWIGRLLAEPPELLGPEHLAFWRVSPCRGWKKASAQPATARWHHQGRDVLYASLSHALALLEALGHRREQRGRHWTLCLRPRRALTVSRIDPTQLPSTWTAQPALTRAIGDAWLDRGTSAVLLVPSAHRVAGMNALLAMARLEPGSLALVQRSAYAFDRRLSPLAPPAR